MFPERPLNAVLHNACDKIETIGEGFWGSLLIAFLKLLSEVFAGDYCEMTSKLIELVECTAGVKADPITGIMRLESAL
jgi:hypothetical protein